MIQIEREVAVGRPPDVVFDYLADVRRFPRWQPAIERAEQVTPGPLAVGSRVRLVVRGPTGPTVVLGEVSALVRPDLIAVRSLDGPADVQARCEILPDGGGSRVTLNATVELKGMLRFVEGAARGMIERQLPSALAELARLIEAEA